MRDPTTQTIERYRQLGYGHSEFTDGKWLAVWLDCESCTAGNLLTVQSPPGANNPIPYNGTIYRTLREMMDALS